MKPLAIVGIGTLGEVLLTGLLRAGWSRQDILVVGRRPDRLAEIETRHQVKAASLAHAGQEAQTLILAAKPQDTSALLTDLAPHIHPGQLVISVAAGVPTSFIESALGANIPVIRAMPNTPALVDEAMTVLSPGAHTTHEQLAAAEKIFTPIGRVLRLPERQQDAVTALSGSGPAYFFFLVEAMIDAAILLGIPRTVASDLITQTALGAARMLRDTNQHPVQLREAVTSPAGTTINAIRELDIHGVRAAILAAIEAAALRSAAIAATFTPPKPSR